MLLRSVTLTPTHVRVPLCSAAARRQVSAQAVHLDNGSRNLDLVASRFKSRLQGASRQVKSRLDGAEAQQDALASRLDILESQCVNSLAISFMALFLAMAASAVLGSNLPGALLTPFMLWAAVSRWVASGDLTKAYTYANWDLETAQAEGLADLEACQSQAMDDLAKSRLHDSSNLLDIAAGSRQARRRDSAAKQQIKTEVKVVQKRMAQRVEMLQSRLKQLRDREGWLSWAWGVLSSGTLFGTFIVAVSELSLSLDDAIHLMTPVLVLTFLATCLGLPSTSDRMES